MNLRMIAGVAVAAGLMGCGGTVTVYRGTLTNSQTYNGATTTDTITGHSTAVYSGGEANSIIVDLGGGIMVNMTKSGETLTAAAGQSITDTATNSTTSQTVSSGSGTQNAAGLTLLLSGTFSQTSAGNTANGTFTVNFTGTKQ